MRLQPSLYILATCYTKININKFWIPPCMKSVDNLAMVHSYYTVDWFWTFLKGHWTVYSLMLKWIYSTFPLYTPIFLNFYQAFDCLSGTLGLIWVLAWCLFVHESPASHPNISITEKTYIVTTAGDRVEVSSPQGWRILMKTWVRDLTYSFALSGSSLKTLPTIWSEYHYQEYQITQITYLINNSGIHR